MSHYAIGQLHIRNTNWLEEYTAKIGPLFEEFGAEVIAKGKPQTIEGKSNGADIAICIAFPSEANAKQWYAACESQGLVTLRQSGSDFTLDLVEGVGA